MVIVIITIIVMIREGPNRDGTFFRPMDSDGSFMEAFMERIHVSHNSFIAPWIHIGPLLHTLH